LQIARGKIKVLRKQPLNFSGELQQKFLKTLPFELTSGQKEVIAEISQDQKATNRMFRLLQGDVGSGKTVVAFCAMLNMVEGKKQAALMVPTEILARQHYHKLLKMGEALDIKVGILINAMKSSEKESTKNLLERGEIDVVVGTHALFQEHVKFKDLGLVVIDEQHRFGVEQRLTLIDKGKEADYLMMTATPIPRTLEMAAYGDIDISTIREKPHGRQEIVTSIVRASKIDEVLSGLKRMLVQGNKIYWVCPLIDDSEKLSLANVKERFDFLNIAFPGQVGLIHGQMSANGREESMAKFLQGEFKILVATTVIEVGVDVPDATVIIIENAERFGLSQLHQLRGRVGRSDKKSYCILLAGHALGDIGYARLSALKDSNDGFELAEKDLNFRGRGDLLGTKQSGLPNFRAYDFFQHNKLIPTARAQAQEILAQDPKLTSERGEKIKMLLHLFEMDKSLSYIETCR
jgi:ATP-dependent DNA helicase RecG